MTNQTHQTFPTKRAAAEHQKRTSAAVADAEEEKHILADRYKTKMCKNYVAKGECPYEVRCMFAHGEKELRSSEDNIRDGLLTEEAIKAFQRQQNQAKRRAAYAAAREAEARAAAAAAPAQMDCYADAEEENEMAYYSQPRHHHNYVQQRDSLDAPRFVPQGQHMEHAVGVYVHNPYAFNIIPAEAREFIVYEEVPEEGYWYEEPMAMEENYYFPSAEMMAPLVPSSVTQQARHQQLYNANPMYSGSFSDEAAYGQSESSDYSTYAVKTRCGAAEMPDFSDEAPMVLEP